MIQSLMEIAQQAGNIVLSIYNNDSYTITGKMDGSVLTEADTASHDYICAELSKHFPAIPIISEESNPSYENVRQKWEYFFLVDPLDGTKEFIKRNGEFTINIALIQNGTPMLGVVYAPALNLTYYAEKGKGAYKIMNNQHQKLAPSKPIGNISRVAVSRSHACHETTAYLDKLKSEGKDVTTLTAGSALKFGLVAEDKADIYLRIGPTMEWDTAAGHVIVNEVGKKVIIYNTDMELTYNKDSLTNPGFIVQ